MAVDMQAMRERLKSMNTKGKSAKSEYIFKPDEGTTQIRIVPLAGSPGDPFQELKFHYGLGGRTTYLSPLSYGERDPVAEFSDALVSEGNLSKDEYKQAKKFYPQTRTYVPVVVIGKEEEGVKFWAFGATIFKKLLEIINDEDYGDIMDPENGRNIKVKYTPAPPNSQAFAETDIQVSPRTTPLTTDAALMKKLLNEQPVLMDQFTKNTFAELEQALDRAVRPANSPTGPKPTVGAATAAADDEWGDTIATPAPVVAAPAKVKPAASKKAPAKLEAAVEEDFDALFGDESSED